MIVILAVGGIQSDILRHESVLEANPRDNLVFESVLLQEYMSSSPCQITITAVPCMAAIAQIETVARQSGVGYGVGPFEAPVENRSNYSRIYLKMRT